MSWRFRKIFRLGPFGTSISKSGVGVSWGIPGFRIGVSGNGRKYLTLGIPGTGIYFTKFFNQQKNHSQQSINQHNQEQHSVPPPQNIPPAQKEEPWWKQKNL